MNSLWWLIDDGEMSSSKIRELDERLEEWEETKTKLRIIAQEARQLVGEIYDIAEIESIDISRYHNGNVECKIKYFTKSDKQAKIMVLRKDDKDTEDRLLRAFHVTHSP